MEITYKDNVRSYYLPLGLSKGKFREGKQQLNSFHIKTMQITVEMAARLYICVTT